jgi:hypothetical protein
MKDSLREIYGAVYLITFPEGTDVPFRALSYGDFCYYNDMLTGGLSPPYLLEDELFKKCVTDQAILDNIHKQKAGTISTTVSAIMQVSGPADINEFNQVLQLNRETAAKPINYLPTLICRAFPAYTPEDIDKMSFETMLLRLAQAEQLLLAAQVLKEPIALFDQQAQQPQQKQIPTADLKSAFDRSMQMQKKPIPTEKPSNEISPAAEQSSDIMSLMRDSMSSEGQDSYSDDDRLRQQTIHDAKWIYKDLIEQMRQKNAKQE